VKIKSQIIIIALTLLIYLVKSLQVLIALGILGIFFVFGLVIAEAYSLHNLRFVIASVVAFGVLLISELIKRKVKREKQPPPRGKSGYEKFYEKL